ncbi:MAG TPA: UDP-4-amino-4,6-dideoxy-N-acetyl-beta-L-altrosamine transaminase [Desulfobacterales bacterium]|nr:UDP-4-amino-4,6-dideoxy-N-acetyl-beta-L-altrosamine transaminase [Desulfobacterales bacterium]
MKTIKTIPYGRQSVAEDDIAAVTEVLCSEWLTTGPKVPAFEEAVAGYCGARHGVAVSSGTAALHAAMYAIGIETGDEVIVPAITFAATANCVVYQGGRPIFADVEEDTLLIDSEDVIQKITDRTKAIIAMDYAGHPCNYEVLSNIAKKHDLFLIADSCHALGAEYRGRRTGTLADLTTFSFHPVKHITTGEGGMIVTNNTYFADRMRMFRNHGITSDHRQRAEKHTWKYDMVDLGYNYRLSDIQCALGISQLKKLPNWLKRRQEIAARYDKAFMKTNIRSLSKHPKCSHAYHLYVVRVPQRDKIFNILRESGIGVNVHYAPLHLHPYYRSKFNCQPGICPKAERAAESILSLPIFPALSDLEQTQVITAINTAVTDSQ